MNLLRNGLLMRKTGDRGRTELTEKCAFICGLSAEFIILSRAILSIWGVAERRPPSHADSSLIHHPRYTVSDAASGKERKAELTDSKPPSNSEDRQDKKWYDRTRYQILLFAGGIALFGLVLGLILDWYIDRNAFNPDTIRTIATALSTLVAIGALIVAFLVERRNQARFEEQLRQSRELAQASIKPFLTIVSQNREDLKSVKLINRGIGPAVITKVVFSRSRQEHATQGTTSLVDLFRIDRQFKWDTFRRLPADGLIVRKDETIDLVKLSKENLLAQGISEQEASSILAQWRQQKTGIQILLEYEDVLGNRQPAYEDTLN